MDQKLIQGPSTETSSDVETHKGRDLATDYLRAFLIVLVVLLHAALAYTSFSYFNKFRWIDSSAPVVDTSRWPLLDPFILYLDTFLMALLFLISGLFTLPSLERQGSRNFFIARLQRLGIPFIFAVLFIAPLAFLPSYLMASPETQTPYLISFFTSDGWPTGPPWFLWVLLAFDGIVALLYRVAPNLLGKLHKQPTVLVVFLITVVAFLPLRLLASHFWWLSWGPIDMQPVRLGLYFACFLLGMAFGAGQEWRKAGWLKNWGYWFVLGIFSFVIYLTQMDRATRLPDLATSAVSGVTFAVSCAGASLGFLGAARKLVRGYRSIFDSLSANSYGIYIVHYAFVIWIQFALLETSWPAPVKFFVTFIGSLALSWGASKLIRKIPAVRRIL